VLAWTSGTASDRTLEPEARRAGTGVSGDDGRALLASGSAHPAPADGVASAGHELDSLPAVHAPQRPEEVAESPEIPWAGDGQVLVDPVTALYSESYLLVALDARIAAARRRLRPVSVVMVEVVRGLASGRPTPSEPKVVADAVRATLREADTASRMNDGRYALVLEDTPENGAIWTVERLRSCLVDAHPDFTVWAGVACYPAHAFNLDEILVQATTALEAAKEWRQDRIEVATAE
jgi:two-component system cell cycle response regulator